MVFVRSRGTGLHIFNYADKPDFTTRELVTFILHVSGGKSAPAIKLPEWLGLSLGSLLDFIGQLIGAQFPINRERVQKFCSSTEIDAQSAFATGFAPRYTIEEALQLTVKDYVKGSN